MIPFTTRADVLIFKTNVQLDNDVTKIATLMEREARITRWNIDREDFDKVLRIESRHLNPNEVIDLVRKAGYHCEELTD
jgi:hypothetical protein